MPTQYQLKGASLEEIRSRAERLYGKQARILKAEKVRTGGLVGLFSKEYFEALVQVPASPGAEDKPEPAPASRGRSLLQLLEAADQQELGLASGTSTAEKPTSSTFESSLHRQMASLGTARAERTSDLPAPMLPGQQIVVIGLGRDALEGAAQLDHGSALRRNAGELTQRLDPAPASRRALTTRQGILRAQAAAVEQQRPLVVSLALSLGEGGAEQLELLVHLIPDQLWVVVDASRKVQDTVSWVERVAAIHPINAVLGLNGELTQSPDTVAQLGYPVRWAVEDMPIRSQGYA